MSIASPRNRWFGINWQLSGSSGWGLLGMYLAVQAERDADYSALPLVGASRINWFAPQYTPALNGILDRSKKTLAGYRKGEAARLGFPVLHSLGNRLGSHDAAERMVGSKNIGFVFFEESEMGADVVSAANRFDTLLAGSSWNTEVLRRNKVTNAQTLFQGLDLSIFKPVRPSRAEGNPFVIFSGGKLEFRKGQDIVVEAFRRFRKRHREAILLTIWHNHWAHLIRGIDSRGYVFGLPVLGPEGSLEITTWLEQNGIPPEAAFNLPAVPNYAMPQVYQQADVALFPNRCEGGTNLVAMECMASGLPTILSINTGHLDLIDDRHCYPLLRQAPVAPVPGVTRGTDGWGESDIDEILERLEQVYVDAGEAAKRGEAAASFMRDWSWRRCYAGLKGVLGEISG